MALAMSTGGTGTPTSETAFDFSAPHRTITRSKTIAAISRSSFAEWRPGDPKMGKLDAKLLDTIAVQAKTIAELSGSIATLQQEKFVLQAGKENLETQYHKLRAFIRALGLRADTIEADVWINKATALINVSLHEDNIDKRLGFPAEDAKDHILHVARNLFAYKQTAN